MSTIADIEAAGIPITLDFKQPLAIRGDAQSGWESDLTFIVPFGAQTDEFISIVAGKPATVQLSNGTSVSRIIPLVHPVYKWMLASNLQTQAIGGQSDQSGYAGGVFGTSCWSHNRIQITFRSIVFPSGPSGQNPSDGSSPFMEIDLDDGTEYITIPGAAAKWASDGHVIKQDGGIKVPTTVYSVTVYQCGSLGDDVITPLKGSVNSEEIFGKPAGTVRLDGFKTRVVIGIAGVMSYTRTLSLTYRAVPHNYMLRATGNWELAINTATGNPFYDSNDLNLCFV